MSVPSEDNKQGLLEAFFLPDLCNTRAVIILLAGQADESRLRVAHRPAAMVAL